MQVIKDFVYSNQFWKYHGFVLSGLWVLASALGIYIKKFNTFLHLLIFGVVDYVTFFFAAAALFRILGDLGQFMQWSLIKQFHISGGTFFLLFVLYQHIVGVIAYHKSQPNRQHRNFGKIIVIIGRIIAGFGWILGQNKFNAIIVGVLSTILYLLGNKKNQAIDESVSSTTNSQKGKRD